VLVWVKENIAAKKKSEKTEKQTRQIETDAEVEADCARAKGVGTKHVWEDFACA
jgi:hypothetical protein